MLLASPCNASKRREPNPRTPEIPEKRPACPAQPVPAQAQALLGHAVGVVARKVNRAMQFNCSVSNLPGPQQKMGMLGGTLCRIGAAMPVMNGFGLFVGLTTCAGQLTISMSSSANILPDPTELGDCMEQSYAELKRATRPKTPRPKRTRKQN